MSLLIFPPWNSTVGNRFEFQCFRHKSFHFHLFRFSSALNQIMEFFIIMFFFWALLTVSSLMLSLQLQFVECLNICVVIILFFIQTFFLPSESSWCKSDGDDTASVPWLLEFHVPFPVLRDVSKCVCSIWSVCRRVVLLRLVFTQCENATNTADHLDECTDAGDYSWLRQHWLHTRHIQNGTKGFNSIDFHLNKICALPVDYSGELLVLHGIAKNQLTDPSRSDSFVESSDGW